MKRVILIISVILVSISVFAQKEMDTVVKRCPIYITDTSGYNNYFLEFQPATIHIDKAKGDLSVVVEQRDQFFSMFFGKKHLENKVYKIKSSAKKNNEVAAK